MKNKIEELKTALNNILMIKKDDLLKLDQMIRSSNGTPQNELGHYKIQYSILYEEIEDIKSIINNNYNDEVINKIYSSTTSSRVYEAICKYKGITTIPLDKTEDAK